MSKEHNISQIAAQTAYTKCQNDLKVNELKRLQNYIAAADKKNKQITKEMEEVKDKRNNYKFKQKQAIADRERQIISNEILRQSNSNSEEQILKLDTKIKDLENECNAIVKKYKAKWIYSRKSFNDLPEVSELTKAQLEHKHVEKEIEKYQININGLKKDLQKIRIEQDNESKKKLLDLIKYIMIERNLEELPLKIEEYQEKLKLMQKESPGGHKKYSTEYSSRYPSLSKNFDMNEVEKLFPFKSPWNNNTNDISHANKTIDTNNNQIKNQTIITNDRTKTRNKINSRTYNTQIDTKKNDQIKINQNHRNIRQTNINDEQQIKKSHMNSEHEKKIYNLNDKGINYKEKQTNKNNNNIENTSTNTPILKSEKSNSINITNKRNSEEQSNLQYNYNKIDKNQQKQLKQSQYSNQKIKNNLELSKTIMTQKSNDLKNISNSQNEMNIESNEQQLNKYNQNKMKNQIPNYKKNIQINNNTPNTHCTPTKHNGIPNKHSNDINIIQDNLESSMSNKRIETNYQKIQQTIQKPNHISSNYYTDIQNTIPQTSTSQNKTINSDLNVTIKRNPNLKVIEDYRQSDENDQVDINTNDNKEHIESENRIYDKINNTVGKRNTNHMEQYSSPSPSKRFKLHQNMNITTEQNVQDYLSKDILQTINHSNDIAPIPINEQNKIYPMENDNEHYPEQISPQQDDMDVNCNDQVDINQTSNEPIFDLKNQNERNDEGNEEKSKYFESAPNSVQSVFDEDGELSRDAPSVAFSTMSENNVSEFNETMFSENGGDFDGNMDFNNFYEGEQTNAGGGGFFNFNSNNKQDNMFNSFF